MLLSLNKKKILFYLDLASEVPPATSNCETACAELESNPWLIHENPVDISRREHNCIYASHLIFSSFYNLKLCIPLTVYCLAQGLF